MPVFLAINDSIPQSFETAELCILEASSAGGGVLPVAEPAEKSGSQRAVMAPRPLAQLADTQSHDSTRCRNQREYAC